MRVNTILATFILLISFSVFAKTKDTVIATVNGEQIKKSEFLKAYRQNKLYVSNRVVTKQKVLNDMIAKRAGVQKARKNRLQNDPTVKEKLEDILYHAQISKDLEDELQKIKVSDLDVKTYYKTNPEYRTAQILIRTKVDASAKDLNNTLKVATDIYQKVSKDGSKFGEFANRYSQTGNAKTGGDMGFQPAVKYAPEYFKAINGKKAGFITPPVKSQFGFHIIKVLAVKDFKDINLGIYKKVVYDQKRDAILQKYFKTLRSQAKITVNKAALKDLE